MVHKPFVNLELHVHVPVFRVVLIKVHFSSTIPKHDHKLRDLVSLLCRPNYTLYAGFVT